VTTGLLNFVVYIIDVAQCFVPELAGSEFRLGYFHQITETLKVIPGYATIRGDEDKGVTRR